MAVNYIEKILLENFQSHEHTELDLTQGLNIFVGPSDSGKTAIIRAIKWALYNEPRGMEFMRQGASFCRVTLSMSNGYTIVRERSSSYNRYILIAQDGQKQVFEGFGNEIPVEVLNAHGIRKVVLDENNAVSINIGQQLEGPFMLTETGATRAKALGRLVGVHIIDRAMQSTVTDITRLSQQVKQWDRDINNLSQSIERFDYLPQLEQAIEQEGRCIDRLDQLTARLDRIAEINRNLKSIEMESRQNQAILSGLAVIPALEEHIHNVGSLTANLKVLKNINRRWLAIESDIAYDKAIIKSMQGLSQAQVGVEKALASNRLLNKYIQINLALTTVYKDIKKQQEILHKVEMLDDCQRWLNSASNALMNLKRLETLKKRLEISNAELSKAVTLKDALQQVDKCRAMLSETERYMALLNRIRDLSSRLKDIDKHIVEGQRYITQIEQEINEKAERYGEILMKVGRCPVCMSKIDVSTVEDIVSSYKR
jgi:exonuclease SbcC